jgi:hypothetical protein
LRAISKFLGELLAVIDLCPPLLLVILQDDLAVLVRYVFQATLQTLIFRLGLAAITNDAREAFTAPASSESSASLSRSFLKYSW